MVEAGKPAMDLVGAPSTYTVRVRIPLRTPAGRELETYEQEFVLRNPPHPVSYTHLTLPTTPYV